MSYYIYGFRIKGGIECRYIGMTGDSPYNRLSSLTCEARGRLNAGRENAPDGLHQWLLDNKGNIDAFKIGKVETAAEARAMERTIIALVLRLGHRLLNAQHVPEHRRIGYIPTRWTIERRSRKAAA